MRPFCTDRPTKSNGPCTVDAGHFQYETDFANWTYFHQDGVTQNTYLYANPTFKLGVTNRMDFQINFAPFQEVNTHDKSAHAHSDVIGVSDLFLRVKYNLFGNDSGDAAIALFPFVKIPTAPPGIGNKAVEEGLIVPVSYNLPQGFSLSVNPEIDGLKNSADNRYHANYQAPVSLSHTVFSDSVTGYAEFWEDINKDPSATVTQLSADAAFTWLARPDLQFDIGANVGLNRATPGFQGYGGISQRF